MKTEEENIKTMTLEKKLQQIQVNLKAPKNQFNSFSRYNYRSCEDILEAVKPLLEEYNVLLLMDDFIYRLKNRYYVRSKATLVDIDNPDERVQVSGFAREAESKKGMDESQLTGATSSYARKYALNALFLIDDTKDADTDEYQSKVNNAQTQQAKPKSAPRVTPTKIYRPGAVQYVRPTYDEDESK